ncbi:2-succinyl-5-enolpyruvyl-6-hydroxy-3-cyclohexene-1-carboxylic-acid synthase [Balneola sp. MJW-20]|uniref:2-succinyl-5-enolpyruvyl-6-hydroxy-3- cyclohexene-1-carboxylic-acid synthase n=1 Tax=Gracilimonas aurantiaca TaxID=3234185 RepID=UPI0034667169
MQENEKPQNVAFYWCSAFARTLFEEGIEHIIISPGSRSTPLVMAFVSHPGFRIHTVIDERTAAFTALGIAKTSGKPAVLICTSGTAAANYYPAVIEATQSNVPLIIAGADRPYHLQQVGASQTIDQLKLFGDYPVYFQNMGEPSSDEPSIKRVMTTARQAAETAMNRCGVAHINFPFRKPFEPDPDFLKKSEYSNHKHSRRKITVYSPESGKTRMNDTFWSDLTAAERPLIVAGPATKPDVMENALNLAKILQAPLLAEPGSNLPHTKYSVSGFDGFLSNENNLSELEPDLILRFGQQVVSKALNRFLERTESRQISFISNEKWVDGSLSADRFLQLKNKLVIPDIHGAAQKDWLKKWRSAERSYRKYSEELLHPTTPIADGYVFAKISELIPKDAFTFLSNSFPVRDMSMFGQYSGKEIYTNRGAAGIDGILSTAIGSSIALKKTGILFIGDIAFLHDSNALLNAGLLEESLVVVVLNNGGGTIFRMLPIDNYPKHPYRPYFETPQRVKISALCRAHKVDHSLVTRPEQIIPYFETALDQPGLHVLECITDPDNSMKQRKELWNFELES